MSLLLPLALLGFITLPIIFLLHLLRNRRDRLTIASLHLWRYLEQSRTGQLPRTIPFSIMLLLQFCVATSLTVALARPVLTFTLSQSSQTIFIVDISSSMLAQADSSIVPSALTGATASRFDAAIQAIKTFMQTMDSGGTIAVVSLSPRPELLLTGAASQKETIQFALDNIEPGATGSNLGAALTLANGLVDPNLDNQIVLLTDGNYPVEPQNLPVAFAPVTWQLIPESRQGENNQALFDVSARRLPDDSHRLFARVVNYGVSPEIRTLRLSIDGAPAGETTLTIDAQTDAVQLWTVPAGAERVAVEIVEPDALPLDNIAELFLVSLSSYRVLLVSDTPETLIKAFSVQPGVVLVTTTPARFAAQNPADYDLLVFDGLPSTVTTWPKGKLLLVNPPLTHPLLPRATAISNQRPNLAANSPLLTGIDLSGVYFKRVPQFNALPTWVNSVDLQTSADPPVPLIFQGSPTPDSQVLVWAFDLDNSNLPGRVALPLLAANTVTTLLAPSPPPAIPLGEPVLLGSSFNVETPTGERLFLSEKGGYVFSHTKQPGLYKVYNQLDQWVAGFAVHAGAPQESNLAQQSAPNAIAVDTTLAAAPLPPPAQETDFTDYWPWLAGLAVIIVTVEGWLAWRR